VTSNHAEALPAVAISVSDSPDMAALGLSNGHLRDAVAEIALHLLSAGVSLAYGGDLRQHGFTERLLELVERYRNHPRHRGTITVTNYLAWPVHIRMNPHELDAFVDEHKAVANLVFLARDGTRLEHRQRLDLPSHEPDEDEWAEGLTAMRTVMRRETRARVVVGGRVKGYQGAMPGIAEEICLSLEACQPVFLLGGFGGCTRDIAETVGLADRWAGSRGEWVGRNRFFRYSPNALHNGLSLDENTTLTPHIEEAIALMLRGLRRILNRSEADAQGVR